MEVPKEYVQSLLAPFLTKLGLDPSTKFEIRPVQARLWLSNAFKVTLYLDDKGEKKLSLFVKSLPTDILRKEVFGSPGFFRNEVGFYNHVSAAFMEFQRKRLKDGDMLFDCIPNCYTAMSNGENDIIMLEDMQEKGYVMSDRLEMMDLPKLHLLMREIGRFHALSLSMKDQEPDNFKKVKSALEETVWNDRFIQKIGRRTYTETCADAIDMLMERYPADSKYVLKLQRLLKNVIEVLTKQALGVEENEPLNVVTHGDMWVNNLMFLYSEGNVLERMCFLDFQQSRYASLALDISSVLYVNMEQETRDKHRDALLRSYHDSLCELMRKLGSDPDAIFPFDDLEKQLKKYSIYSLAYTFMNVPQAMDVHEAGVEEMELLGSLGQQSLSVEQIVEVVMGELEKPYRRKTDQCKKRVLDVIKEMVDRGYLDHLPE